MSHSDETPEVAPGDDFVGGREIRSSLYGYLIGLALAVLLTFASFALPTSDVVWGPGIPVALVVFAVAQMGVHIVFFLHITTSPDNTNNVMALAFGILIVFLVIGGSVWIMWNMNYRMGLKMPTYVGPAYSTTPH
ncbi:MAG TPA: cytochrome o ubiquinol oxidase subunit IV [Pseudolabrys sp.]|nr:cytochrome o ubiquinol oxidase subunit IV [Pseudolabrys sp.]